MERIKDALERARLARETALLENSLNTLRTGSAAEINALIDARRIRERVPLYQLTLEEQQTVIAAGTVLRFETGEHVFEAGSQDESVHYLLEGAVTIYSATSQPQTLYAHQEAALLALDEAGVRSHTVTAVIPSRVFRVGLSVLESAARLASPTPQPTLPEPATAAAEEAGSLPRELYAHTYSGEQLAQLVEQLHEDSHRLRGELGPARDAAALDEVRFGEDTLGVRLDDAPWPREVSVLPVPPAVAQVAVLPSRREMDDGIGRLTRELETRFLRYVEQVRDEERRRAQTRLQQLAEQQLRAKIETVKARYQAAYAAREKTLRDCYEHLLEVAHKITRQKAAIYHARRQLEEKLRLARQVHHELAQVGLTVTRQLNDLEGMFPAGDAAPATD
jgi:hypothetical protein